MLAACTSVPLPPPDEVAPVTVTSPPAAALHAKSRWEPVRWSELPGFGEDTLQEAWSAWLKSCERPLAAFAALCPQVRQLATASTEQKRDWMMQRLQPYRVESLEGGSRDGLLTAYYEPQLEATRQATTRNTVALYRPPANLASRRPWYTRQEIDSPGPASDALRGREIAYVADPLDALLLQVQGSGRARITEADGSQRLVRLSFAGSNEQPYRSIGSWLLQQGAVRDASWPGIRAWAAKNPQRVNEMLWSNPRVVFFREEPLPELEAAFGPRGAQGVALTPGRSIAVDKDSIPFGTPVWLASPGPMAKLQKLVLAQDTGSAILGAGRADYFTGSGAEAGDLAGRLRQPMRLWVLWPR